MKAVLDIGSNSVRLRCFSDGKIIYNGKITSQLGKNISEDGLLDEKSKKRTTDAVKTLAEKAEELGAKRESILAFSTAAVRNSKNGKAYAEFLERETGIKIDILSGETEAETGLLGALSGGDGAVLDIGGASSELAVKKDGKIIYSHSLPFGAVTLYDECGEDYDKIMRLTGELVKTYGQVPEIKKLVAVGGTATSIAHAFSGQKTYVPEVIQGLKVEKSFLDPFVLLLSTKTIEERCELFEDKKRARVIVCGGALLSAVLGYLNLGEFYASEADNLEGYCLLKTGAL